VLPLLCERGSFNTARAFSVQNGEPVCAMALEDSNLMSESDLEGITPSSAVERVMQTGESESNGSVLVVPSVIGGVIQAVFEFETGAECSTEMVEDFSYLAGKMVATEIDNTVRPDLAVAGGMAGSLGATDQSQMDDVYDRVIASGSFNSAAAFEDTRHYFNTLGLPADYFKRFTAAEVAQHLTAFMSAKKLAASADPTIGSDLHQESINVRVVSPDGELHMAPLEKGSYGVVPIENRCDELRATPVENGTMSIARYVSTGPAVPYGSKRLAIYHMDEETWNVPGEDDILEEELVKVTTKEFLKSRSPELQERYQGIIRAKLNRLSPHVEILPAVDGVTPVYIATRMTTDKGFKSSLGMDRIITELLGEDLVAVRKFTNTFSNGLQVNALYLETEDKEEIDSFVRRIITTTMIPRSAMVDTIDQLTSGVLSAEEYAYASAGGVFVYYFLGDNTDSLKQLREGLSGDAANFARLQRVSAQLHRQALPQSRIDVCIKSYPELIKAMYADFNAAHNPKVNSDLSTKPNYSTELSDRIDREVIDELDRDILKAYLNFNESVPKTNFYSERSSTIAFRLEPEKFFPHLSQFPKTPYGLFLIMSGDFRGFHVRFMPVARGGLRMIPSANPAAALRNRQTLFNENYGLAYTQDLKNKDIPEFGSKGTILPEPSAQNSKRFTFCKYMSGMMDLILPESSGILDHHGKEEIIFFGPDEGTADVMEWAAYYSRDRGYNYWKGATTGKPPSMGGIPHDAYGMTTRSVHANVVALLAELGIDETTVTKLQTGGPDGDLGSNEITMSKDKTIAIVDGSGVVFDPNGLDREEMTRLAHKRCMVDEFDTSKLSDDGGFVGVGDTNITLKTGEFVASGELFRNEFHFHPLADAELFVPCGGRPESINEGNVHRLFDANGKAKFKYIVEGANLFLTEGARDTVTQAGVILIKDASSNKGGVTSSSFEVLTALAMSDAEHAEHMCAGPDGELPEFYKKYVEDVIEIVEGNAYDEYAALSVANKSTGLPHFRLTDVLSNKINELNIACQNSDIMVSNVGLRRAVLAKALPKSLQDEIGLDVMMERLPDDYIKAVVGYYVACRYVYKYGVDGNEFTFYDFMSQFEIE
jgi:glutamate dehydrogenase